MARKLQSEMDRMNRPPITASLSPVKAWSQKATPHNIGSSPAVSLMDIMEEQEITERKRQEHVSNMGVMIVTDGRGL